MVTVTNADVKVRYVDTWPADVTDAMVTALCAVAEKKVTVHVGNTAVIDLTAASWVVISTDVAVQLLEFALWRHTGGYSTGIQPPKIFTSEILADIQTLLQSDDAGVALFDGVDYDVG